MQVAGTNNVENLQFVFHLVPQPWHPQSSILHEYGLVVRELFGNKAFFKYASLIFSDAQTSVFDDQVFEKSRKQLYEHLCKLSQDFVDEAKIMDFLTIKPGSGNSGNSATNMLKLCVKYHRVRSVHVTPTVFINGVEAPDVSSGWTVDQWTEKLKSV